MFLLLPCLDACAQRGSAGHTLRCTPDTLDPGDTLTLTMSVPHGGDIVIVGPDRFTQQFVCGWDATAAPGFDPVPLHPYEVCKTLERIELTVGETDVWAWGPVQGVLFGGYRTRALSQPGTYMIHLSEGFGLPSTTDVLSCMVRVTGGTPKLSEDERRKRLMRDLGLDDALTPKRPRNPRKPPTD